jgi:hypothetical protein
MSGQPDARFFLFFAFQKNKLLLFTGALKVFRVKSVPRHTLNKERKKRNNSITAL